MGAIEVYEEACLRAFYVVASGSVLSTARNAVPVYVSWPWRVIPLGRSSALVLLPGDAICSRGV